MKTGRQFLPYMLIFSGVIIFLVLIMQPLSVLRFQDKIALLFPKGIIAIEERNMLFILQAIMLVVIIPVYFFTFLFSWIYRANNPQGKYDPDFIHSTFFETLWWGIPFVFTAIIAVFTWIKTHELDPFKPIESDRKPITIQVIALQWKWLFIYPEEQVAGINYLQFPKDVPLRFEITADAPMNSFWIPDLGGQIYAMPSMRTELNLIAQEYGDFRGSSANLSGEGFSGMHFIAKASTDEDYLAWIEKAKNSSQSLDYEEYNRLVKPSKDNPQELYALKDIAIFNKVLMKYMHPQNE